ncbi:hypothetical protein BKA56DRAFT_337493 [Ilyonectria sp. MPI-CAGE-AT-0026]|nr:hypothetical protein BKA56DRAFT_337493 [Ilyonectria sp. MPI-CAGE-AT-0026]
MRRAGGSAAAHIGISGLSLQPLTFWFEVFAGRLVRAPQWTARRGESGGDRPRPPTETTTSFPSSCALFCLGRSVVFVLIFVSVCRSRRRIHRIYELGLHTCRATLSELEQFGPHHRNNRRR